MVYKVKRKAEKNYFNVTTDSQDDPRFKFEFNIESEKTTPDYSYNWPYDFFSLVELAKLDASVTLSDSGGTPGMTSQDSGHAHTYILDSNGNGYTEYAYHPGNMKVKHRHKVVNGIVEKAQSDCYPDCKKLYGVDGVPLHAHKI